MKLRISSASRLPDWPAWAVSVTGLWLVLAAGVAGISRHAAISVETCWFKMFTGIPCPTCGLSRAGWAFLKGDFLEAWLYNPLFSTVLALYAGYLIARLISGSKLTLSIRREQRLPALVAAIMIVLLNWIYLISSGA